MLVNSGIYKTEKKSFSKKKKKPTMTDSEIHETAENFDWCSDTRFNLSSVSNFPNRFSWFPTEKFN